MDFFDHSPDATGMTYRNSLNPGGVTIDGVPDTPTSGLFDREMVTGAQGTITHVVALSTNLTLGVMSYYLDAVTANGNPSSSADDHETHCTGDAFAHGASGVYVNSPIASTEPSSGNLFTATRVLYHDAPNQPTASAITRRDWVQQPLQMTVSAWEGATGAVRGVREASGRPRAR